MPDRCRNSRDPNKDYCDASEFGFGAGPILPGKENAPPSEGGVYRAMCPPVELTPSDDLSVRARETPCRRGDPLRGYPGEQVARQWPSATGATQQLTSQTLKRVGAKNYSTTITLGSGAPESRGLLVR
jgi:hypothetical protein